MDHMLLSDFVNSYYTATMVSLTQSTSDCRLPIPTHTAPDNFLLTPQLAVRSIQNLAITLIKSGYKLRYLLRFCG